MLVAMVTREFISCRESLQVFEKFTKESTSLLDELSVINDGEKSSSVDKYMHTHTHTHAL